MIIFHLKYDFSLNLVSNPTTSVRIESHYRKRGDKLQGGFP